jgi:L-threonylcarbamoyladenylate synthase
VETILLKSLSDISGAVQKAAEALRAGGVVLYPTDTLYGLGADALSDEAVGKIYATKGRDEGKPIHALVGSVEMAEQYADISPNFREKIKSIAPCSITFICNKKVGVETGIAKNISTFGFRIPDNAFCLELVRAFGGPITATSANKSGETPQNSIEEILAQLGVEVPYIGLVVDAGVLPPSLPSTVVDLSSGTPQILREGAVPAGTIQQMLG